MSLNIGDVIDGKYKIVRLLGEGGMGSVFEGENLRIHRKVAIKILHANIAASEDAVQRFEREAQAAGRIGSDHIVEVLDLGELPDGDRYMVMEYLDGEALSDRIQATGGIPPSKAACIVIDMLEGLKAAHEAGIVHRDLKPENVFLLKSKGGKADFVKLVDFGISKFSTLGGEFSMTRTGSVMGTPYYLSPEQAKGERSLDHRADLYAVGVILYEAAVGKVPFEGETFNELLFKIVLEPVKPLTTLLPSIDPEFSRIVDQAMQRDPNDRFQSAEQLQNALRMWLQNQALPEDALAVQRDSSATGAAASTSMAGTAGAVDKTHLGYTPGTESQTSLGQQGADQEHGAPVPGMNKTRGAWVNTNADGTPAFPKRKWGLVAAAAAILLMGGGVLGYRALSGAEEAAQAAARAEADREREAEEERARFEERARIAAEKAAAEAERERARIEAEKLAIEARLASVEQAQLADEEKPEEAKATPVRPRPAPRPVSRPVPRPTPAPAPAPQPTGRKFRTDL